MHVYVLAKNGIWSGILVYPKGIIRYELFRAETITFHFTPTTPPGMIVMLQAVQQPHPNESTRVYVC